MIRGIGRKSLRSGVVRQAYPSRFDLDSQTGAKYSYRFFPAELRPADDANPRGGERAGNGRISFLEILEDGGKHTESCPILTVDSKGSLFSVRNCRSTLR